MPQLTDADRMFYRYCGLDCCTTYECNQVMDKRLMPGQRKHYEFNMSLLNCLLYMELRGIKYDYEKAKTKLRRVTRWANVLQDILNRAAGRTLPGIHEEAGAAGCRNGGQERGGVGVSATSATVQEGPAHQDNEGSSGGGGQAAGGESHSTRSVCKQAGSGLQVCEPQAGQENVQEISGQSSAGGAEAGAVSAEHTKEPGRDPIPHDGSQGPPGQACSEPGVQESEADAGPAYEHPLVPLIASQLCLAKPRRREEVTTTRTFKNGKAKTTTKTVSKPVAITTFEDCREFAKESCKSEARRIQTLLRNGVNTPGERGLLAILLNLHIKVNSTGTSGDACWFLYERCGFPKQFQKEGNRLTDRLASDDEALIKIWVAESKKPQAWTHGRVRLKHRGRIALVFLKLRRLLTQTKTLRVAPDADGRMRCGYNLVGTETARLTCYESPTGSGYNLQTVTKPHRELFMADDGYLMAQCDLAGADGWTVAAYAAAQGDRTMLDDYKASIKPAKVGVLMWQQGPAVNKLSRDVLKQQCKAVNGDSWQYFGFKRVQHGSSYKMGKFTMSDQILTDSWKLTGTPVFIAPATCEQMQQTCFFARYWGIPRWHAWMEREVKATGCLVASNGFKRLFFGRKDEHDTVKQALAHLPQVYTTASTMMALARLWNDPDNRHPDGSFKVEPLHTVHDSLLTQFKRDVKDWSMAKHREWFNNPVLIAQETLVIPFEGACGRDWKHLDEGAI